MLVPADAHLLVATAARRLEMAAAPAAAPVLCTAAPYPVATARRLAMVLAAAQVVFPAAPHPVATARRLELADSRTAAPVLCTAAPDPVAGRVSCRRWKRYITVTSPMVMTPETNKAHARVDEGRSHVLGYATRHLNTHKNVDSGARPTCGHYPYTLHPVEGDDADRVAA